MDGDAGRGGNDALDSDNYNRRSSGIDSKQPKDQSNEIRINRSDPGSGPGVGDERRTETLPANDMAGNAADFHAQTKKRVRRGDIRLLPKNKSEAKNKSANEKQQMQVAVGNVLAR